MAVHRSRKRSSGERKVLSYGCTYASAVGFRDVTPIEQDLAPSTLRIETGALYSTSRRDRDRLSCVGLCKCLRETVPCGQLPNTSRKVGFTSRQPTECNGPEYKMFIARFASYQRRGGHVNFLDGRRLSIDRNFTDDEEFQKVPFHSPSRGSLLKNAL